MPRMPAYITGVLILQHNAATIELQQCHMPSIELQQCHGQQVNACLHAVNWITTMPWTQVNACLHYGGAYINDNWIELQQCHGRQVNACSAIALLVPTYYNNAICLHTYITMPYACILIYSFPAWKKAFQHIYSFPQKTATMSETYR